MNNTIFNGQQQMPTGYFPYGTQAVAPTMMRQEVPTYMMPQSVQPAMIKGRPVSSLEEARVAQIDLDGSIFVFPDLGNKKIYTKRINADGTACLQSYSLDLQPETEESIYATKSDVEQLKATLDEIINKFKGSSGVVTPTSTQAKINF